MQLLGKGFHSCYFNAYFQSTQGNVKNLSMLKIKFISQSSGIEYEFDRLPITIGRTDECDLLLGGSGISKKHARIEERIDGYHIIDLDSLNGVAVNGERITNCLLEHGDIIQFGSVHLELHEIQPAKPIISQIEGKASFKPRKSSYSDYSPYENSDEREELEPIKLNESTAEQLKKAIGHKSDTTEDTPDDASSDVDSLTDPEDVTPTRPEQEGPAAPILLTGLANFHHLTVDLAYNCRYDICILSQKLDRTVFHSTEMRTALFDLIKRRSSIQVKILVKDTRDMLRRKHEILNLYRRIPSNVSIKKIPSVLGAEIRENYVIFDSIKTLHQKDWHHEDISLNYSPSQLLALKVVQFRYVWEMSRTPPELKTLTL